MIQCPNCRAQLPAGSRFCNHCGLSLVAQTVSDRTQQVQPPAGSAYTPPPAYRPPQVPPAYTPPPSVAAPAPTRSIPLWIPLLLLTLILGGGGAAAWMLGPGKKQSVTGAKQAELPKAPGLPQVNTPGAPSAPPVLSGTNPTPPPAGAPLTQSPPRNPDEAPSILMAPGAGQPGGPSITQVRTPAAPAAPSVVQAPGAAPRPAPPVSAAPAGARPAPPKPPDNSDLDRYLQWLRFVEQERATLRAMGETQAFRAIEGFYQNILGLADPTNDEAFSQERFNASMRAQVVDVYNRIRAFQASVVNSRRSLMIPQDCVVLDNYYMQGVGLEAQKTGEVMNAFARRDIGGIRSAGRGGIAQIDMTLKRAQRELAKVFDRRNLYQNFDIEVGGGGSLLGGMMGMGL